jgi:hypothetical protein
MVDYKDDLEQIKTDLRHAQILADLQEAHLLPEPNLLTQLGTPLAKAIMERGTRQAAIVDTARGIAKTRGESLSFGLRPYTEEHVEEAAAYLEGLLAPHRTPGVDIVGAKGSEQRGLPLAQLGKV